MSPRSVPWASPGPTVGTAVLAPIARSRRLLSDPAPTDPGHGTAIRPVRRFEIVIPHAERLRRGRSGQKSAKDLRVRRVRRRPPAPGARPFACIAIGPCLESFSAGATGSRNWHVRCSEDRLCSGLAEGCHLGRCSDLDRCPTHPGCPKDPTSDTSHSRGVLHQWCPRMSPAIRGDLRTRLGRAKGRDTRRGSICRRGCSPTRQCSAPR